jgi:hypothetical protein
MFNLFKKPHIDESSEEQRADLMRLPGEYSKGSLEGADCDEVLDAHGEFGRCITNPIPVNGPHGEIKYINRLRNKNGSRLIFHRIGSTETIDVYETVSVDANTWDILYFDMYHPRRSTKTPKGYKFSRFNELIDRLPVGLGSTRGRDIDFPFGIGKLIELNYAVYDNVISSKRLAKICDGFVADRERFKRPEDHEQKLRVAVSLLFPTSYFGIKLPSFNPLS